MESKLEILEDVRFRDCRSDEFVYDSSSTYSTYSTYRVFRRTPSVKQ